MDDGATGAVDDWAASQEPLTADQVYILMKKDYRISRNVRAQWFIDNLNRTVTLDSNKNDELIVLSIVPLDPPKCWTVEKSHLCKYVITAATRVIFLAEKYRMVYCLDISPSLSAVDIQMGEVMLDCLVSSVKASLEAVSCKFTIPGSTKVFQPDVYATIIAHTPFFTSPAQQVLVQGWQVTPQNLPQLLIILEKQLQELEGKVAEVSGIAQAQLDALRAESEKLVGGLFEESLPPMSAENPMVSPDTGFINMLRFGMLALKLLPDSSSANIIVVTDGIINIPDVNIFDSVLSQLRSSTVCCSFLQVAGSFHPNCCKGFVPYTELMHFLASATQGAYITAAHKLEISKNMSMNVFHEAFLTWSFQHSVKAFSPKSEPRRILDWDRNFQMGIEIKDGVLMRKKQAEGALNARLKDVLSCRLREGYFIKSLSPKDPLTMEVCLVLPWKNEINIEYLITSQSSSTSLNYIVTIEAPYEFLHDITCLLKKPFESPFRRAVVARFWHTFKNLQHTDQLLEHLHSFGDNALNYSLPDSVKSGVPLFQVPTSSQLTAELARYPHRRVQSNLADEPQYSQITNFWLPICVLEAPMWQKWLHGHRLGLLLRHDDPLPLHLHQAAQNGRFQQVQCRHAGTQLNATLKDWSSFVLLEAISYAKLIQNENEKTPTSFLLMRVNVKVPCVVINIAFLGGASGNVRHKILEELKSKLRELPYPRKIKEPPMRKFSTVKINSVSPEEQNANYTNADLKCCILLVKPVEKILIRYERMPLDFATVVFPDGTRPAGKSTLPISGSSSMLTTLSRYLHHRRWIWVAQPGSKGNNHLNKFTSLSRTLKTITNIRLQEGFTFAHSTAGIVNMLLEVTMQAGVDTHPCVIQYVLFPPHQVTNKESGSDEECTEEVDPTEPEGELQIITEVWIEPQYGHVIKSPPERAYMDGLSYDQLADELCKMDAECISCLLTFEHLIVIGNEKAPASLPPSTPIDKFIHGGQKHSSYVSMKMLPELRIKLVPFTFNLVNLLPKCQQAEMLFSSFVQDLAWSYPISYEEMSRLDTANNLLLNTVYESMLKVHDCELFLSHVDSKIFFDFLIEKSRDPCTYESPIIHHGQTEDPGKMSPGIDVFSEIRLCDKFLASLKLSNYPKWKCYLKRLNNSHLILTFLPASFADLKLLMLNQKSLDGKAPKAVRLFPVANVKRDSLSQLHQDECTELNDSLERLEKLQIPESCSVPEMSEEARPATIANAPFRNRAYSLDAERKRDIRNNDFRKRPRTCSVDLKEHNAKKRSPQQLKISDMSPKAPPNQEPQFGAVTLPIYVYDCPLASLIDVLVYKENEISLGDIYEDHTCSEGAEVQADGQDSSEVPETSGIEANRMHLGSPEPKSEDLDLSIEVNSLKRHCKQLKTSFQHSYVSALYKSLQIDSNISAEDLQNAIRVCSEVSIELDFTRFLMAVCGHLKELWINQPFDLFRRDGNSLRTFTLPKSEFCGPLKAKHTSIKEQFAAILSDFFKAVPSNPKCFFSIPKWETERQVETDLMADHEDANSNFSQELNSRRGSQSWDAGGDDTHTSDSVSDLPEEEMTTELCPLFLHLMCSVQHGSESNSQHVSSIPVCINETGLITNEINLSSLKILLEVQCLTLPSNIVEPTTSLPIANNTAIPGQNIEQTQVDTINTLETSVLSNGSSITETELKSEEILSRLSILPEYLQKAVTSTISKIKWLLQDELATSLLVVYPPLESTLQMVAQHVISSSSFTLANCSVQKIPLNFVFGAEHSLNQFLDKFAQLRINFYFLRKESNFYYLVQDLNSRQHKMQSTPVNGPNFKSIATPSSLAEDSSEMSMYQNDIIEIPQTHYSESDIQGLGLDSTPTDEPLSRPLSDLKLSAAVDSNQIVENILRGRKASADLLSMTERKDLPPTTLWLDTCSSSAPTPSLDMNKEILSSDLLPEEMDQANPELLWDKRVKSVSRPGSNKLPFSQRTRNLSGAVSSTGPNSETSSFIESGQGTEEGYDGDSSDDSNSQCDDFPSWNREQKGGVSLPNFWLVMEVCNDEVVTYFHCRAEGKEAVRLRKMHNKVMSRIIETCKEVNQFALLQSLHETKTCDDLLEGDAPKDLWDAPKSRSNSYKDKVLCLPGIFSCDVVWETQFLLHPRLKTGPAKRGIQALESVLSRFPVNNRKNMFVYQDNLQNVFYLRLHESNASSMGSKMTPSSSSNQGMFLTDGEMTPPGTSFVRSPSISSLKRDDGSKIDIRPRVKSYGERDMPMDNLSSPLPKMDEIVILKVHGITEAGSAIKEDLVQVLHNRLDDAVLEVLCGLFLRNPMCKLTPDDVHFIQKPNQKADMSIDFSIQPFAVENLQALVYYLRQNLLEFLLIPKYTDVKSENHFQDYTHDDFSKDRVPEEDIFLYIQSRTSSGNKGMACIAMAVVDSNGRVIIPEGFTKPCSQVHVDSIINMDFVTATGTVICDDIEKEKTARIEFRIWKQGKVNLDLLTKNLQAALQHSFWDLQTEYRLLTPPLSLDVPGTELTSSFTESSAVEISSMVTSFHAESPSSATVPTKTLLSTPGSIDKFESGEQGRLHQVYQWVISEWLGYAFEIGVPSVKKLIVHLKSRQMISQTLKEMQKIIAVNAPDSQVAIYKMSYLNDMKVFMPYQPTASFPDGSRWDDADNLPTCFLFSRNLLQWKSCVSSVKTVDPDILYPKAHKVLQKFPPLLVTNSDGLQFVPRQRLVVANLSDQQIVIYTYNWSKDRTENMHRQMADLGNWLVARSNLTTTIVCQKMGLFHNMMFNRQTLDPKKGLSEQSKPTLKDVEQLIKPPVITQKDFNMVGGRRSSGLPSIVIHDVFRDNKPSRITKPNMDPVTTNGQHLLELFGMEKRDSQKKLHQLWESKLAMPSIPVSDDLLQLLKQHSRVVHFCLTPLLYLPSWRIQAAATRDHTLASNVPLKNQDMSKSFPLAPHSRHESGSSIKSTGEVGKNTKSSPHASPKFKQGEDQWHTKLCLSFIEEYKHYLSTVGFLSIQTDSSSPKKSLKNISKDERQRKLSGSSVLSSSSFKRQREDNTICHFLQKCHLGGILIFVISLHEPFIQVKLYAIENARLQANLVDNGHILHNQYLFPFLDECDKIKIAMHLHSFAYDHHLRCIHNYITKHNSLLSLNFHLKNFLDDFIKYYSKAPNFARNLVYADGVRVTDTKMPALQLFNFLWTHVDLYKMEVFCMSPENEFATENEYVLVQLKSVIASEENNKQNMDKPDKEEINKQKMDVPDKEENNKQKPDKPEIFDVTLVVSNVPGGEEDVGNATNVLNLKYYILLTSHRQENVKYMGYYSLHEQTMQRLILDQANKARDQVLSMVHQGMEHCRTHILWETLLRTSAEAEDKAKRKDLTFNEFHELLRLASMESLSSLDPRLNPLLCQPLLWYQNLEKVLIAKYGANEIRRYSSGDQGIQHTVVLSTNYLEAFMLLSVDSHTSRGELSVVCRKGHVETLHSLRYNSPLLRGLVEDFVNACSFHLWASLI
ncbi:KICSTOR complex protein SZT2-like isoform X3 [Cloeon dipterum]|uniref:KICSTOR complex protein SZT2-like isoform X3 n=1 Tax=Cloeon dipterum TaxID=197152 RepID=UPI00321FBD43